MTLHPPAPVDLDELVEGFAHTTQTVIDLGRGLRPGEEDLPTDCPGWSVADQIRHVASVEASLLGEPEPDVDVSRYAHIRNTFGALVEKLIEARRSRTLEDVLGELEGTLARRLTLVRDPAVTLETPVVGPFGPTTVGDLLSLRLFDIWVHEQDIREAIGRPGNLDGAGAANALAKLFTRFPRTVAKDAAIAPGHAVILDVTGPVLGRVGVRVEEVTGAARGIPLFSGEPGEPGEGGGESVPMTTISMSTRVAGRLLAGRRTPEQVHVTITGDESVAGRVLAAMAFTP